MFNKTFLLFYPMARDTLPMFRYAKRTLRLNPSMKSMAGTRLPFLPHVPIQVWERTFGDSIIPLQLNENERTTLQIISSHPGSILVTIVDMSGLQYSRAHSRRSLEHREREAISLTSKMPLVELGGACRSKQLKS